MSRVRSVRRRITFRGWCGVLFFGALLPACASERPDTHTRPDTLTIAHPEGKGAAEGSGASQVAEALSMEGLTRVASDGKTVKRIADDWAWRQDGLELHVTLRSDVTLHDGRHLTAAIAAEILRAIVASPENQARYTSFADITGITASGEHTFVIALSRRSSFLPEDLSIPFGIRKKDGRIGTGPYREVKREGSTIELERFERYYQGPPTIARVSVGPSDTLRTAFASFLRRDLGMVTDVPPDIVEFVRSDDARVISFSRPYQYLVAFNSARPKLSKPAIRRALNLAVSRDQIVKTVLHGYGMPATGPIWPKHWAYDPAVKPFDLDLAEATRLLDSAGLTTQPATGNRPPARLRFTCLLPENFSIYERVSMELQRQLYEIGVDIDFETLPLEAYGKRLEGGDFEAAFIDMISAPSLGRPYAFWRSARSGRGFNMFGYENPRVEALFQTLRASTSELEVRNATHRLQQLFLEDPPAIFLAWNERSRAVRREFGARADAEKADPLLSLWQWGSDNPSDVLAAR